MSDPTTPATGRTTLPEADQVVLLESILESSTEYSIVAEDPDGTIVAWNEGARRLYGHDAADVVGKVGARVLHAPEDLASGRAEAIRAAAREAGKWEGELQRVRKDGGRFSAHVTVTLRRGAGGRPIGLTIISRDLTASQHIERELRDSQEYNRAAEPLVDLRLQDFLHDRPHRQLDQLRAGVAVRHALGQPLAELLACSLRCWYPLHGDASSCGRLPTGSCVPRVPQECIPTSFSRKSRTSPQDTA
jgi:PAS domain S-box-containing protein